MRHPVVLTLFALYVGFRAATTDAPTRVGPWGPRWIAHLVSLFNTKLLGIVGHCPCALLPPEEKIDPKKQHVVTWHPHGAYTTMAFMHSGHHTVCVCVHDAAARNHCGPTHAFS